MTRFPAPFPANGVAAAEAAASWASNSDGCCGGDEALVVEAAAEEEEEEMQDVDGGEKRLEEAALGGRSESLVSGDNGSGGVTFGEERTPHPALFPELGAIVNGTRRETLWKALPPSTASSLSIE